MKIDKVKIVNFKGLKGTHEYDLNGKTVFVKGGNAKGKTSFIDAIWGTLTGKDFAKEIVTTGEKKSLVELDLGDYVARLKTTKSKSPTFELEAKTPEGNKPITAPRTWLNEAIGVVDFDVMEFLSKSGAEQVKYLCKVMGIDFTAVNDELVEAVDQRRLANKELANQKGAVEYYDKTLAALSEIDIAGLSKRIADAAQRYRERAEIQKGIDERKVKATANYKRIDELKAEIERLSHEAFNLNSDAVQGQEWLSDPANDSTPDAAYDQLKADLNTANDKNKAITEAKRYAELETKIVTQTKIVDDLDAFISAKRSEKAKLLSDNLDVPDLEYNTEDELFLWKGLPFDKNQINTADQIIAGLKIGATFLKDLRILRFDGSLIDNSNFEAILAFAKEANIELFVEIVDREGCMLEISTE